MARTKQTARTSTHPAYTNRSQPMIGCWYPFSKPATPWLIQRSYLPLSSLRAHTVVKDVTSRTTLTQSFINETSEHLENMVYSFPMYAGVSVVSLTATIDDVTIKGVVKEKLQARHDFDQAVAKGESAALLEQLPEASDVFTTHIGNVPAGSSVEVQIEYIGELIYDSQADGIRLTIPASIAPRHGSGQDNILSSPLLSPTVQDAIQFIVDVHSPEGCAVRQIQSPSHPIAMNVGRSTDMPDDAFLPHRASATLSLDCTSLDKDFVVMVNIANANVPKALLETHCSIPNQRALLVTLVPNFKLSFCPSEIVFVVDRSGSMDGKMDMVIRAMTTMLKSLRVGVKFNICSFGSNFSFLWPRSKAYNEETLNGALSHIADLDAGFGGTEMLEPVRATIAQRYRDLPLNVIILTDGQIWGQEEMFRTVRESAENHRARFFSLGIGSGASTSLVQGIAAAGSGISQFVADGEQMDKKMVRLLKAALSPYLDRYSLDLNCKDEDDDWDVIESIDVPNVSITLPVREKEKGKSVLRPVISFFDKSTSSDDEQGPAEDRFAHVPTISPPSVLQAPVQVPPLYSFSRVTLFLLLDSTASIPDSVVLRASSEDGPLELEIKVEDAGKGETIHQLAARKAVSELESGHGWLTKATEKDSDVPLKTKYESLWDEMVEREAIRLGVKYQIAGKWCSFVALENNGEERESVSFGGKVPQAPASKIAPRKQLASKAARRSAPSSPPNRVAGAGVGGAKRHRRVIVEREQEPERPSAGPMSNEEKMNALIGLQKFNGSWEWEQSLLDIIGLQNLATATSSSIQKNFTGATALAVAFFQHSVPEEKDSWELVVEKAMSWLDKKRGVDGETEVQKAIALLSGGK